MERRLKSPDKKLCLSIFLLLFSFNAYAVSEGDLAPGIRLPTLLDLKQSISLETLRGKVVYVDFWASWCSPCRKSIPQLNTLRNTLQRQAKAFEVFAVNLDKRVADANKFLGKYPVDYPVVFDAKGKSPKRYGVMGMPTSYLLDASGRVRYIHSGFKGGDIDDIRALVEQLLLEGKR